MVEMIMNIGIWEWVGIVTSPVVMVIGHEVCHFLFAKLFNVGTVWKFVRGDSLFMPIRLVWNFCSDDVGSFEKRCVAAGGLCGPLILLPVYFSNSLLAGTVYSLSNLFFLFSYMVFVPSTSPDFDDFFILRESVYKDKK